MCLIKHYTHLKHRYFQECPQGSVLGPLLLLLYINDLPSVVYTKIRIYADDCVLYHVINSPGDHTLNASFLNFCTWCQNQQMNINFQKTVAMCFTRQKTPSAFNYSFNNYVVQQVPQYKYLGFFFTTNLSLSQHIDTTCNKT